MVDHINEEISDSPIALLIKTFFDTANKYGAEPEKLADYLNDKVDDDDTEKRFVNILCNCHAKVYREVCSKI